MKKIIIFAMLLTVFTLYAVEPQISGKQPRPKIVAVGTAGPTIDYLIKNHETVEKMLPTDGTVIFLDVPGVLNGKPTMSNRHNLFANWKWEKKWFEPSLKAFKKIKLKKLTDNFIYVAVTGAKYDMFDDAAWNKVYHNIAIMSWYAKEAGFKGIFLDIEHYTKGQHALFEYNPKGQHSFEETWLKTRERGREFMNALTAEYPDITNLGAFGLSANFAALAADDPMKSLKGSIYGLAVAFYNGIYDVMPKGARLLDGCEGPGYKASGVQSFLEMSDAFFRNSPQLLSRSNWDKFFNQSGLSPGLYLDCYLNEKGFYVIKSPKTSRLNLFRNNLMLAMKYSQGYIWLYSEQCRWFPAKMAHTWEKVILTMPGKGRLWEDAMPGITASVEFAKDPKTAVLKMLKENKLKKIFSTDFEWKTAGKNSRNGALPPNSKVNKTLKGVFTWQSGSYKPQGTLKLDTTTGYNSRSSAKLTGINFGCIGRIIPVKPEQVYYIRVVSKSKGLAKPKLTISWQDSKKKWTKSQANVTSTFSKPLKDGWKQADVIVTVPKDVYYMGVQCMNHTYGGQKAENICWFDDLAVYRVF